MRMMQQCCAMQQQAVPIPQMTLDRHDVEHLLRCVADRSGDALQLKAMVASLKRKKGAEGGAASKTGGRAMHGAMHRRATKKKKQLRGA